MSLFYLRIAGHHELSNLSVEFSTEATCVHVIAKRQWARSLHIDVKRLDNISCCVNGEDDVDNCSQTDFRH